MSRRDWSKDTTEPSECRGLSSDDTYQKGGYNGRHAGQGPAYTTSEPSAHRSVLSALLFNQLS